MEYFHLLSPHFLFPSTTQRAAPHSFGSPASSWVALHLSSLRVTYWACSNRWMNLTPRASDSVSREFELGICIPNKFPVLLLVLGPYFENHRGNWTPVSSLFSPNTSHPIPSQAFNSALGHCFCHCMSLMTILASSCSHWVGFAER